MLFFSYTGGTQKHVYVFVKLEVPVMTTNILAYDFVIIVIKFTYMYGVKDSKGIHRSRLCFRFFFIKLTILSPIMRPDPFRNEYFYSYLVNVAGIFV